MKTSHAQHFFANGRIGVLAGLAVLTASACAPYSTSPRQIEASNPTVTYKYRSDDELIKTNQLAATFCDRYQSVAQPVSFSSDASGERVVIFECTATSAPGSPYSRSRSDLTYTYRTDRELMDISRNAQAYCLNSGSSQVVSNIVSNGNGTKTVTFQCRAT